MNKTLLTLAIACTLTWMGAHAQPIMSYNFESKAGNYEEITDGTVILSNDSLGKTLNAIAFYGSGTDNRVVASTKKAGIPIGFDFVFNNTVMKQFVIGGSGFLAFGENEVAIDPSNPYFLVNDYSEGKNNIVLSVRTAETHGGQNTEISYKVTGEPGSKVLIVQYKNLRFMDRWGDEYLTTAQLQFRLYEGSNKIEIIYKDWKRDDSGLNVDTRIGIKGSIKNDLLMVTTATASWSDVSVIPKVEEMTWTSDSYPADGLTYIFTAVMDCEKPAAQPENLVLTPKTISVSGSFDKTDAADHYLTVMTETESFTGTPADNTYYIAGDKLGNGTVIAFDTLNTFETPQDLTGDKTYYFHVLAANTFCMYGPKYNVTNPLTKSIVTMPAPPTSLEIAENGYEKIVLKAKKNAAGNKILIAMTTEYCKDKVGNITENGLFGQPTGMMTIGQEIEGGGKVIYVGEESEAIPVEGLENNNLYHFIAWSLDDNGNYSTVGANVNVLTWGRLPYEPKFEQMPGGRPYGWEGEGDAFSINQYEGYRLFTRVPGSQNGVVNTLITPWVLLGEERNRFILDLNIFIFNRMGNVPYNEWKDNDLFELQISKDGTNFAPIQSYTKKNAPQFETAASYTRLYMPVDTLSGEKVKFKIYWKCYTGVDCYIKNLKIEEKGECDYPIELSVDANSIVGDQALASWKSRGEENLWEMRYRIAAAEGEEETAWGEPFEVNTNPYLLTKLPAQSNLELQIRAKCSLSSQSVWSETCTFTSGYVIPFTEGFKGETLPAGWNLETGALTDSTEFCTGRTCSIQWRWTYNSFRPENNGLSLSPVGTTANEWVLMPVIDLEDGSANYTLNFDLSMKMANAENDETYSVVISTDGGKTFSDKNVIKTFTKSELPQANDTTSFSVPLKGYKGQVRLGLYVKSTSGRASQVQLLKVSIDATCPSDIVATVSDITPESAKVTWTSEAEEFYVFIRKAGETKKEYEKLTVKEKTFSNLEARTTYEVGITKMCAVGDTAKVVIAGFTTPALAPCAQVTDITEKPSQFSAVIAWTGDAANYNIRYRLKGTENWATKNTTETSYTIENLEPEKEYEYGVQSVCSAADGDQSEWTETKSFTTLAITCFPPTNIQATPTHKSATITWEGEADKYEIGFRKGTEEWTTSEVTGKTKEFTGLEPETTYSVRLRGVCSATDKSTWSSAVEFATTAVPACVAPTNLAVTSLTATSAKLNWDADESNLTWDLRYRPSVATAWTNVEGLTVKTYDLTGLTESTAYLWTVKATCDEGRTSAWATQNKFTTEASGISETAIDALNVYVSGNVLNVINGEHCWIDNIQVYSLNGQMLYMYPINSDENVLIPMYLRQTKVIVKVNGKVWDKTFHILFK